MKNYEKHLNEILSIISRPYPDNEMCKFIEHVLNLDDGCQYFGSCVKCRKRFGEWLNEEYKEPIAISAAEQTILKNLPANFKWIARDSSNRLYIYKEKPRKREYAWYDETETNTSYSFNLYAHLFQFIKWEDDEPYSIEELLKEDTYEPSR